MKDYNYGTLAKYYDQLELVEGDEVGSFNKVLNEVLKKNKVKTVLDMTCGTGIQSIYLQNKGYKVTASDFSKEMLEVAKKKSKKIKFHHGDIRNSIFGKFDCVISMFNAIGHLSKKDFEKAINNVSKNLNEKGLYIFDIFNYKFMKNNWFSYKFLDVAKEIDDMKFVRFNENTLDRKKHIMNINQETYVQHGIDKPKIFNESWDMQIYTKDQVKDILERNGFEIIKFLDRDGSKFDENKSLFILTIVGKK